jgi:hypothetical protein
MITRKTMEYKISWPFRERQKKEPALLDEGWRVESEEFYTKRNWANTCCLLFIFFPLALFAIEKCAKITYIKET